MSQFKLLLKIIRIALYLVAALIVGAVIVFTLTAPGRQNLAGLISSFASSESSKVRVGGLSGIWAGPLKLDHVVLEDADGPWLVVRGVEVDWSLLPLFSATFDADRVHADRIEIARLPKASGGSAGGSFSLPLSLALRKIDLPDIALGRELAGDVAQLSVAGSLIANADPMTVQSDISVNRRDGVQGSVDASVHFVPADNRLDVDIRGSEPSGGILANLLKLPGTPAVDILVSGSGPASNWSGKGTFAVDGAVVTQISGTYRLTDKGHQVVATGDGDFESFLPEDFRPLLAGKTVFDIAGMATPSGGVDVERAMIESDALTGSVAGIIDPEGASDFALDVKTKGDGVPLAFGTQESPIDMVLRSASVRAIGDGRQPNLDISAVLTKVATNTAKLDDVNLALHSDGFDIRSRIGPVAGTLTTAALTLDNATIAPLVAGQIKADFSGILTQEGLTFDKGSFTSDAVAGNLNGTVSLADGAITLELKADVASAALPAAVRPVLAEKVAISGNVVRDAQGHVSATPFTMSSGALSASGTIKMEDDTVDVDIAGKLGDVSLIAKDASGAVDMAIVAKGPLSAPDVSLTVTSDKIVAAGREISALSLTATGKADAASPQANVSLKGNVAGEALSGSAVLKTTSGKREINGLTVSLGQNRITGDLTLDESFVPEGTVKFALPDVGPLAALALETAEGDINGTVRFSRVDGVPSVSVDAKTSSVKRGDLSAENVAVTAVVANYMAAPAISGVIKAKAVKSGTTAVSAVDVALTRDGDWTGFSGGATVNDIPATAKGRVRLADGVTTVELSAGQAVIRGLKAALSRSGTIVIRDGQTRLDRLALTVGGGAAEISGTVGQALALDVKLSALPASVANAFAPGVDAAGSISGTVNVRGQSSSPEVAYAIDWKGAQTGQTRSAGFGALSITSNGSFAGGRLTFNANAADGSGLGLKGGGTVDTGGARALVLNFNGSVPFSFLTQRLASQGVSLTGAANVSLQVRGSTNSPVIGGSITANGARFVDARSGIAVGDVNAEISIGGGAATVRRLTGTLSTGGTVSASGTVGIDAGSGFPADLSIKIANGRYTDGRIVTTTLSGDLAIKGPLVSAPALSGTVNLARTVITVPEKLPGSLSKLDVKHRNASAAVQSQTKALKPAEAGSGGGGLNLDITVNAPQQIFIQGRGVDAELGGSLQLKGPAAAPQAIGQFTMRRGRLSILGKRLNFTSGTLGFSGSLVPYVDLLATSTANDAAVTVAVTGPATNPKFVFSSVPSFPEDEVLARLIFGRSMSNLSPLQIVQLAQAAAQLAGVGGSTSLLDTLRGKAGVDDLDVKTDEKTGETAVSAGKYLNDRTYVTVEKGQKAGSGKATIDLNVGRGVKLRGEANEDGKAKGGVYYEREY